MLPGGAGAQERQAHFHRARSFSLFFLSRRVKGGAVPRATVLNRRGAERALTQAKRRRGTWALPPSGKPTLSALAGSLDCSLERASALTRVPWRGGAWHWLIDLSSGLILWVSLSGLALIFYFKRRRFHGLVAAAMGRLLCYLIRSICATNGVVVEVVPAAESEFRVTVSRVKFVREVACASAMTSVDPG